VKIDALIGAWRIGEKRTGVCRAQNSRISIWGRGGALGGRVLTSPARRKERDLKASGRVLQRRGWGRLERDSTCVHITQDCKRRGERKIRERKKGDHLMDKNLFSGKRELPEEGGVLLGPGVPGGGKKRGKILG